MITIIIWDLGWFFACEDLELFIKTLEPFKKSLELVIKNSTTIHITSRVTYKIPRVNYEVQTVIYMSLGLLNEIRSVFFFFKSLYKSI